MSVEKLWDELCIGVKCQSNVEIAGSPRNSFRASLGRKDADGRALVGQGSVKLTDPSQTANGCIRYPGVRVRVIRPVLKRETAQIAG